MDHGQLLYLMMVLVAFALFMAVVAFVEHQYRSTKSNPAAGIPRLPDPHIAH